MDTRISHTVIACDAVEEHFGEIHCLLHPARSAKYRDQHVYMSVCWSVCLSTRIAQKSLVQNSPNFLYMLPVAVTQSAMQYVMYSGI